MRYSLNLIIYVHLSYINLFPCCIFSCALAPVGVLSVVSWWVLAHLFTELGQKGNKAVQNTQAELSSFLSPEKKVMVKIQGTFLPLV